MGLCGNRGNHRKSRRHPRPTAHLYAHRLDDTRQQIHWRRGTHGRHVIGLYEIDHIANGIEALLDGVVYFVMHGTYIIGHELSLSKVWRSFQAHRKRVEARPPCTFLVVVFYATLRKFLCNGTDDRRVETSRQQHAVRHIAHELTLHGSFKGIVDVGHTCRVVFHSVIREPVALIISLHSRLAAPIIVAGKERLIAVTLSLKSFKLACHIHFTIVVVADVKRYYAYGVTSNQELVALGIVEGESEDATEVLQEIDAFVAVEGEDHLAVATRLKLILAGIAATNVLMVVDLTIDRQHLLLVR